MRITKGLLRYLLDSKFANLPDDTEVVLRGVDRCDDACLYQPNEATLVTVFRDDRGVLREEVWNTGDARVDVIMLEQK